MDQAAFAVPLRDHYGIILIFGMDVLVHFKSFDILSDDHRAGLCVHAVS